MVSITQNHLTVNEFTNVGWERQETTQIVLHWVAVPGATHTGVRKYFEKQKDEPEPSFASAHYIIGLNGEILEIVNPDHYCRHVGSHTYTPLGHAMMQDGKYKSPSWVCPGIEMCHPDETGKFTDKTLRAAQELCVYLLNMYGLNKEDAIVTHQQVVGWKQCPKWFCDNPQELVKFIEGV